MQSGSYLGEDDIERLEDVYGRTTEPALHVVAKQRAKRRPGPLAGDPPGSCFPTTYGIDFPLGPPMASIRSFPEYSPGGGHQGNEPLKKQDSGY